MWISQKRQNKQEHTADGAEVGRVTLPGDPAGVYLDGERRELPLFGPGGYAWRPSREQQVLVIKTGAQGEAPCVAGARCSDEWDLKAGEIVLYGPETSIHFRQDGVIYVTGELKVNGKSVLTEG